MNIQDKLIKARLNLVLDKCFFGSLALNLKLVENNSCQTFGTDGKKLIYNKEFADALEYRDLQFILCHEVLHCVFLHQSRRLERNPEKWNIACDIAVNNILEQDFGFIPKGAVFDLNFKDMTAEQIYNKLPDEQDNKSYNGNQVKQYDEHKDIKGSKSEIDEFEKDWKINTSKAENIAKESGQIPGSMNIFIKDLMQPKLDWRAMLRQFVNSIAKNDYRWNPPNKRFVHNDMYMPSMTSEALGDVVVILDNSGSTMQYQKKFLSECNGILQQYDMTLHLITVDTEVNSYKTYNKGDRIDLEYKGCGGTDIRVAFEYIKQKYINPSVIVCLTDGYTEFPEKETAPTLWILTDDCEVPFGIKVMVQ